MIINISYDPSVGSAPAGFKTAIDYVVNYFDTIFTNPVTINIYVGWGEVAGQPLFSSALGENITYLAPTTYSQIRNALIGNSAKSATDATAVASLPVSDPTNGGQFDIATAEAKALGLLSANSTSIDGWVGFDSAPGTFTFDPNHRAVPGEYDFIGVAFHEISEVMGRIAGLGSYGYSIMDLFRYAAPGTRQLQGGQPAYFSINSGNTNLDNFNTNSGGDLGDWAGSARNDAFLAFSHSGVLNAFTSADVTVLDAIGWNTVSSQALTVSSIATSGAGITNGNGVVTIGNVVTLTVTMSETVTVAGGTPSLTLNDGGSATFTGGSGTAALTFNYTVAAGQFTSDLIVSSLNLNGATIRDGAGNNADLSGAATYNPAGILQVGASPVAHRDLYITPANANLSVSSSFGVLANDLDPNGSPMTASLASSPSHGTLALQPDGSFLYSPSVGFIGTDQFAYRASDAAGQAQTETVNVTVGALNALTSPEQQITELYVGYFNRAPDDPGLAWWIKDFQSSHDIWTIAAYFVPQSETTALYPFLADPTHASFADVTNFVMSSYQNLFNRQVTAADPGVEYWSKSIAKSLGIATPTFDNPLIDNVAPLAPSVALLTIIYGALGDDAQTIANKVTAGLYYATAVSDNHVQSDVTSARAAVSAITAQTSTVFTAEATTNHYVASTANVHLGNASSQFSNVSLPLENVPSATEHAPVGPLIISAIGISDLVPQHSDII